MTTKPVVVYGASGYTGRLVAEYLREYNVPFVAAGRDKARIAEAMDKVPGIDTIEHAETGYDLNPLGSIGRGATFGSSHRTDEDEAANNDQEVTA